MSAEQDALRDIARSVGAATKVSPFATRDNILDKIDDLKNKIDELERDAKQVSTGQAIGIELQVRTHNMAESLRDLEARLRDADATITPEVQAALIGWIRAHVKIKHADGGGK